MRPLHEIPRLPVDELLKLDPLEVSLACAVGLPGEPSYSRSTYQRELDWFARQAKRLTQQEYTVFSVRPQDFNHSKAMYRAVAMVTSLQRDYEIRYNPKLIQGNDFFTDGVLSGNEEFFADARNLFLHGVIETGLGTCSSLPHFYVAIGRRLATP